MNNVRVSVGGIYLFHDRSLTLDFTAAIVLNPKTGI